MVAPFALMGQAFEGTVMRFAARLDPETRTMRTEIDLPNPRGVLFPGMYARVTLETEARRDALTLPISAVLNDTNGSFVYIVDQNRIRRQAIMTGLTERTTVEIIEGLSENADVVMVGQSAPPAGTIVNAISRDGA
jgi:RND family efflux transporter MFP subunit